MIRAANINVIFNIVFDVLTWHLSKTSGKLYRMRLFLTPHTVTRRTQSISNQCKAQCVIKQRPYAWMGKRALNVCELSVYTARNAIGLCLDLMLFYGGASTILLHCMHVSFWRKFKFHLQAICRSVSLSVV